MFINIYEGKIICIIELMNDTRRCSILMGDTLVLGLQQICKEYKYNQEKINTRKLNHI